MNITGYTVTRLLHPITLAVILVGVFSFLLGLIAAAERQDTPVVTHAIDLGTIDRIIRLETALVGRDAALTELRAELTRQIAETPSTADLEDTKKRIASLEAARVDSAGEMKALQGEITGLAGLLAEAIQTRDEVRALNERLRLDSENARRETEKTRRDGIQARADQEKTIADLRRELKDAETRASTQVEQARLEGASGQAAQEKTITDLRRELANAEARVGALGTQLEQARLEREREHAGLEKTINDLRRELAVAQASVRSQFQIGKVSRDEPSSTVPNSTVVDRAQPATSEPPNSAPSSPATPPNPAGANAENSTAQAAAVRPRTGPIARGVAAYRAEDYRAAYEVWLPEALRGRSRAQFFVGALHFEGRGVPVNRVLSYLWLRVATRNDDPGAIKLLNRVRDAMTGAELDEVERRIALGETLPDR